jgi:hypothetical protein
MQVGNRPLLGWAWRQLAWLVPLAIAFSVYWVAYKEAKPGPTGDQPHYELEAYSLAFDGDRDLRNDYADPGRFLRVFGGPVPDLHAHEYGSSKRLVSIHNVGLPLLLAPAAALSDSPALMQKEMVLIAALAALVLLLILRRLAPGRPILVHVVWAAVAFSLPVVAFSGLVYPEMAGALLALLAVLALLQRPLKPWQAALGATAAALMPWLHVRFLLVTLALVAGLAFRMVLAERARTGRLGSPATMARTLAPAVVPAVVSLAAMAIAFHSWYASFSPEAQYKVTATPKWNVQSAYQFSVGGMFAADLGWVTIAPVMLLALAGIVYAGWRGRWWGVFGAAVGLGYIAFIGLSGVSTGYSLPWRYQVLAIPFAALPLLLAARDVRLVRWAMVPLIALTFAFTVTGIKREHAAQLLPRAGREVPDLPLARKLQAAWPDFSVPAGSGDRYPGAAHVAELAYLLALIGALMVPARDVRRRSGV